MPSFLRRHITLTAIYANKRLLQIFSCLFGLKCAILLSFSTVDGATERFFAPIREVFEEI